MLPSLLQAESALGAHDASRIDALAQLVDAAYSLVDRLDDAHKRALSVDAFKEELLVMSETIARFDADFPTKTLGRLSIGRFERALTGVVVHLRGLLQDGGILGWLFGHPHLAPAAEALGDAVSACDRCMQVHMFVFEPETSLAL